ncbi:subtilisin-like serine protease [Halalkaliarchaeum desulfuricum]|uniref:Subtilisin-like serine protease n=1 Tax=Halalkaliarchaeum desulfuricum TaxID=2055893 RepID=A0A343TME8_9EURY|nr:S8 family serine peptidase [Halalkaliarchaeum desulfuricum]AUX10270.1 subtilisin-like serine protease [Halalkaliarchaeum desulfuricum]
MKQTRRTLLKSIGAVGASLAVTGYASASGGQAQYVVVTQGRGAANQIEREGFDIKQELAGGEVLVVHGPESATADLDGVRGVQSATRDVRLELEEPAETELVEANGENGGVESDWYENLWDKQNSEAVAANDIATGEGTQIGIIDTGVDYVHPDLTPNLDEDAGQLFREGDTLSGDGEDIVVNDPENDIQRVDQHVASDVHGHGTHVAGIAAADPEEGFAGFGSGVQGIAPDAGLVSQRVFWWEDFSDEDEDPDWGLTTTTGDVLAAIDFGAEQALDAVNLSLGTPPFPPRVHQDEVLRTIRLAYETTVRSAVNRGTVVVASAGNADTDLQRSGLFSLPNSTKGAMSISALAPNDGRAFFSNFGTNEIDVGAGGGGYETLLKTLYGIREWVFAGAPLRRSEHPLEEGDEGELWLDEDGNIVFDPDEVAEVIEFESPAWPYPFNLVFSTTSPLNEGAPYGWKAGTSMSAPNTAGLVALVRELAPDANPSQVESAIKKGAEGGDGRSDSDLGAGRINALNTVELLDGEDDGGNGKGGPESAGGGPP